MLVIKNFALKTWGIREYASISDGSTIVVRTKQGAV